MMDMLGAMTRRRTRGARCGRSATAGRKLLVPYITGGLARLASTSCAPSPPRAPTPSRSASRSPIRSWTARRSRRRRSARSTRAPRRSASSTSSRDLDAGVPLAVMTYYNLVFHAGHERFARSLARGRRRRRPSCPTSRSRRRGRGARRPTTPASRRCCSPRRPHPTSGCRASARGRRGFVYAVGLLGVTGERDRAGRRRPRRWRKRLKAVTDVPVLVGVGVSNAEQAAEACEVADGVIVGAVGRAPAARRRGPGGGRRRTSPSSAPAIDAAIAPSTVGADAMADCDLCEAARITAVVPRGRHVLDRRVRDLRGADGGVAGARHRPARRRERAHMHAQLAGGRGASTSSSSTTSTTTCATSPTTTTHARPQGRLLRPRSAAALNPVCRKTAPFRGVLTKRLVWGHAFAGRDDERGHVVMAARTGRSLEEWVELVQVSGVDPLDPERRAAVAAHRARDGAEQPVAVANAAARAAGRVRPTVEEYTDSQYPPAKAHVRPIYDAVAAFVLALGDDVVVEGRSTFVPFVRARQFAAVTAATRRPSRSRSAVHLAASE